MEMIVAENNAPKNKIFTFPPSSASELPLFFFPVAAALDTCCP